MAKGKENTIQKIGSWAFIIGIVIAVIAGLVYAPPEGSAKVALSATIVSILVVLGLIVGFLNVTGKETMSFLAASVSLVLVTSFGGNALGQIDIVGRFILGVFGAMMAFVMAATIIVCLKAIWALAADE